MQKFKGPIIVEHVFTEDNLSIHSTYPPYIQTQKNIIHPIYKETMWSLQLHATNCKKCIFKTCH